MPKQIDVPRIQTTAEYRAGLFDGEGSVTYHCLKPSKYSRITTREAGLVPVLSMGNTCLELLAVMQTAYGGMIMRRNRVPGCKQAYTWTLRSAKRVGPALRDMLPYLVAKKQAAGTMLVATGTYRVRRGSVAVSEEDRLLRRRCFDRVRQLNTRGDPTPCLS